jgi:riboflavin synthase
LFTGLIECTGIVRTAGAVLLIETDKDLGVARGDSLAVNGSCLTVTGIEGKRIGFDVSPETFRRIVAPIPGMRVNLERSLAADGRLHGHFVTGHVDTIGTVTKVKKANRFAEITVTFPGEHSLLTVEKGSIALSGISLTIASLAETDFTVAVIPATLSETNAKEWKPGFHVNIEFDIIGKYVIRAAKAVRSNESLREYLEQYQSGRS